MGEVTRLSKAEKRNAEYQAKFPRGTQVWKDRFQKHYGTVYNYLGWPNKAFDQIVVINVDGIDNVKNSAKWSIKNVRSKNK